jgi:hypothetical protein
VGVWPAYVRGLAPGHGRSRSRARACSGGAGRCPRSRPRGARDRCAGTTRCPPRSWRRRRGGSRPSASSGAGRAHPSIACLSRTGLVNFKRDRRVRGWIERHRRHAHVSSASRRSPENTHASPAWLKACERGPWSVCTATCPSSPLARAQQATVPQNSVTLALWKPKRPRTLLVSTCRTRPHQHPCRGLLGCHLPPAKSGSCSAGRSAGSCHANAAAAASRLSASAAAPARYLGEPARMRSTRSSH